MMTALFGKGQKELKVLYLLITLTLAAILLYPLGCVLFHSVLTKSGALGFENYASTLTQSQFWTALGNSFTVSVFSARTAFTSHVSSRPLKKSFKLLSFYRFSCPRSRMVLR